MKYRTAFAELLSLQYPWGEWSDKRTFIQGSMAERGKRVRAKRGPEGPKPNVARTLFALESLSKFKDDEDISPLFNQAIRWMENGVSSGWYKEWISSGSEDSESDIPILIQRNDIRHTAQIGTALLRWKDNKDLIKQIFTNIIDNFNHDESYWSENGGQKKPIKLLASVYSLELILNLKYLKYRLNISDLCDNETSRKSDQIINKCLDEIERELENGNNLIGSKFKKRATPYLTGLTLLRLAEFSNINSRINLLCQKMISRLFDCLNNEGWCDYSVSQNQRESTKTRTSLRIIAGMSKYHESTSNLSDSQIETIINLNNEIIDQHENLSLDSPDYACILITYNTFYACNFENYEIDKIRRQSISMKNMNLKSWKGEFELNLYELEKGLKENIKGYDILKAEFDKKVHMLS